MTAKNEVNKVYLIQMISAEPWEEFSYIESVWRNLENAEIQKKKLESEEDSEEPNYIVKINEFIIKD